MSKAKKILIVDDEPDIRELLEITISRMGLQTDSAANLSEAIEKINTQGYDLCLTDMNLGDGNGIQVIDHIQETSPNVPVAMITAYGNTETAIKAMKAGAFDYVAKPIDLPKLRVLINTALKFEVTEQKSDSETDSSSNSIKLLGGSESMQRLRAKIAKLSRSMAPVFINGESGSGKELVARMIHQQSPRSSQPFIAVNCGAIPSELMESEFFGHEKGSFTGATDKKAGLFQAAEGGTLFLDEVADLPKDMQVKLLRAIQEKSIRPIGSNNEVPVNCRILSATHKNLAQEVSQGTFRQDLFYRINVIELDVPRLRDRPDDILELSDFFLEKLASRYELPKAKLSKPSEQKLLKYEFPGNVRELENILERAFTLCEDDLIEDHDLVLGERNQPIINIEKSETMTEEGIDISGAIGDLEGFLQSIEKQALELALEKTRWNKTAAAELLGISFRTIRYKLKKLDID